MNEKNESNERSKEALSHRIYVENLLKYYQENDIIAGDPNEGRWNLAHYPLPKRLGGTQVIHLLEEHHAVQGVLQSEEFGVCCVSGLYDQWLRGTEYEELYLKWLSVQARAIQPKSVEIFMARPKEERSARGRKAWETFDRRGGDRSKRNTHPERRKPIEVTFPDGSIRQFPSPTVLVKEFPHLSHGKICEVARGARTHHHGLKVRYV